MNLQENIHRIKEMMGIDNTRHTFDIQKLVDDNIIFVTKPGDGQGGIAEPNWDGDCSVITLDNLTDEEIELNPWRLKAIKHPLPNCIPFVQDGQSEWSDEKYHQVISSIKRAGGDIKDYIMNLQEQTNRIKQMMGVINENKVVDIIQEMGLYDAIRYFGGYDNLTKIMGDYVLSNDDMIWFIMDVVKHLSDKYNDDGVSVWDLDMTPIRLGEPDEELQQIEWFNPDFVTIDVYDGKDYSRHKGSFTERYEDLDDNTLDEVFLCMVDALENNK